jgi:N-acetylneuraminate synthase/pseudaminic acid synthase
MTSSFFIGNRLIGPNEPTFIVAEISANHGGSIEGAIELIRLAARSGADAIKLQTYTPDTITLNSNSSDFILPSSSAWATHNTFYNLYSQSLTDWSWHKQLFDEARNLGLNFFSSPFDETAVDFLESIGCEAYKIASPEITHFPLLKKVANTGKPIILSTGVSTYTDINDAVVYLRKCGASDIAILKCTSSYPSQDDECNLKTIEDIGNEFNVITGFSDHTVDVLPSVISVCCGASIIEKHISNNFDSVDNFFSTNAEDFSQMVSQIRRTKTILGNISYEISKGSKDSAFGKRSIYASQNIEPGEIFTYDNIKVVRPCFGLHPKYFESLIGTVSKRKISFGDRLSELDIDEITVNI